MKIVDNENEQEIISPHRNTLLVSVAFFLIFFGFGTAQQYLVVFFKSQGRVNLALVSLLLLYLTFLLSGIFTPKIIARFGLKNSLLIGALSYAVYTFSLLFNNNLLLYCTSIFIGLGASLLWTSSAQIITDSSPKNRVARNLAYQLVALTFGIIAGLIFISWLVKIYSLADLYRILFIPILAGILLIVKLNIIKEEAKESIFRPFYIFDKKMMLLFPVVFASYYLQAQIFTAMNLIVISLFGISYIGVTIAAVYASRTVGALTIGIISDLINKYYVLYGSAIIGLTGIYLFTETRAIILVTVGAVLMGVFTSSTYTVCLAMLKEKLPVDEYIYGVSVFNIYSNIAILAAITAAFYLSPKQSFLPVVIFLILSFASIFLFDKMTITNKII